MTQANRLEPCPFCGGALEEWGDDAWHHPGAVDCPLDDLVFENRDMGDWNTRVPSRPAEALKRVANGDLGHHLDAESFARAELESLRAPGQSRE